ncbi:MAG: hypothetical protein NC924_09615 [Candidatus Omnitrophica bacterium]|nr:hypothetical protein [Candidatus Omnitrophota bacterium]
MTAGLPGIGIGGIFYLLCAFLMPLIALAKTLAGRGTRAMWRAAGAQFCHASGIMAGFWITGKILACGLHAAADRSIISAFGRAPDNLFQIKPLYISLGVLVCVFATLQISNFFFDRALRKHRHPPARGARRGSRAAVAHGIPAPRTQQTAFLLPLNTQS